VSTAYTQEGERGRRRGRVVVDWMRAHDYHGACVVSGCMIGSVAGGEKAILLLAIPLLFISLIAIHRLEALDRKKARKGGAG